MLSSILRRIRRNDTSTNRRRAGARARRPPDVWARALRHEGLEDRRLLAAIHGQTWHDLDANGRHDAGEPGLSGWTVELRDASGTLLTTTTSRDQDLDGNGAIDAETERGLYSFTGLAAGTFLLREVPQPGWLRSTGDPRVTLVNDLDQQHQFFVVGCGFEGWQGANERWVRSAVTNQWHYILPNGQLYEWDGMSGIRFGTPLTGTLIATLDPIFYEQLNLLTDPPLADEMMVSAGSGDEVRGVDFGNYQLASIRGRTWHDLDANGLRDTDEPFLNGWTMELVDQSGSVIDSAITMDRDVDGSGQIDEALERGWYEFLEVAPGSYAVRQVGQDGWVPSWPSPPFHHEVTVTSGAALADLDFGNAELAVVIVAIAPNPRAAAVDSVTIIFSHAVDGFDLRDLVLTRATDTPIGIPLASAILSSTDGVTWTLGELVDLTGVAGIYTLALDPSGSGIVDVVVGSALVSGNAIRWINGPGDADLSGVFDQLDIVQVLQIARFLAGPPAGWSEGNWNGNDAFEMSDLDIAILVGHYLQGRFTPATSNPESSPVDAAVA